MGIEIFLVESDGQIRIQNFQGQLFECPSTEFPQYAPDYPALPAPFTSRRWTEAVQSVSDGRTQAPDAAFSWPLFQRYLRNLLSFQAAYDAAHPSLEVIEPIEPPPPSIPTIYASLTLSGGDGEPVPGIYPNDPDPVMQTLLIQGSLLSDANDAASVLPVTYTWRIPLFRVAREQFTFETDFAPVILDSVPLKIKLTEGIVEMSLTREQAGIYMISDASFERIDGAKFGQEGQWQVTLLDGPKFFKVIA